MTKTRLMILIGLPILLLGLVGAVVFAQKSRGTVFAGPDIISPTPFNTNIVTGPTALLTRETGEVSYKLPNAEEFKVLETNEISLPTETTVKTGADSLAHVVFPDNSLMSLSKNTEVVLRFEEKKIRIFQIFGNTWHRVESVLQGHEYSVETPTTLATVRGTEFNVGVDETGAEVYVMESVVDVSKIKKVGEETEVEETKQVTKDKHIFLKDSDTAKPMQVVALPADKKKTDWFLRNTKLTEQIKEAEEEMMEKETSVTPGKSGEAREENPTLNDTIKQQIRKDLMNKIEENSELQKIDAQFPRVSPTPKPLDSVKKLNLDKMPTTSSARKETQIESKTDVKPTEKVQGIQTELNTSVVKDVIKVVPTNTSTPDRSILFGYAQNRYN